jgi:hypothetical protein
MIIKKLIIALSLDSIRWYQNGVLHRDGDRPAIIYGDGDKFWFIDGKQVKSEHHDY